MNMPWEKTYDNGIPWFLRRDANNRAPFMEPCVTITDVNDGPDLYSVIVEHVDKLCEDEGCPQHGKPHVCVNPSGSLPMRDLSEPLPWLATSSPRTA